MEQQQQQQVEGEGSLPAGMVQPPADIRSGWSPLWSPLIPPPWSPSTLTSPSSSTSTFTSTSHNPAAIVDKTAAFVGRNGPAFEERVREKEHANPKFSFLQPQDPYRPYYDLRVREAMAAKGMGAVP